MKVIKIIKKSKKKPPRLDGKVLRSLSDNKEFTLAKFKKRFNLE